MKNTIEQDSRRTLKEVGFLKYCFEMPLKLRTKELLLLLLLLLGSILLIVAFWHFTPVVQKIKISNSGKDTIDRVNIEAILYNAHLDEASNPLKIKGKQFFSFSAIVHNDSLDSSALPSYVPEDYHYHNAISFDASGPCFKLLYPVGEVMDLNDWGPMTGIGKASVENRKHKYRIDSYSNDKTSVIEAAARGNGLFFKGRNPYIAFHLTFENMTLPENAKDCYMNMYYDGEGISFEDFTKPYKSPINIVSVFPEPDYYTPTGIIYEKNLPEIFKSHGLYIVLEDYSKKRENDSALFLSSVFLGLVVSLIIQLTVSLMTDFWEWKKKESNQK